MADEKSEYAEKVNKDLSEWIKFADLKAGGVLTLVAGIGALVGTTADDVLPNAKVATGWWLVCLIVSLAAVGLGAVFCTVKVVQALSPKTPEAPASLSSFPDIAKLGVADYGRQLGGDGREDPGELRRAQLRPR